jgi:hypothetical protein
MVQVCESFFFKFLKKIKIKQTVLHFVLMMKCAYKLSTFKILFVKSNGFFSFESEADASAIYFFLGWGGS